MTKPFNKRLASLGAAITASSALAFSYNASANPIRIEAERFTDSGGTYADGQPNKVSIYSTGNTTAINYVNRGDYVEYEFPVPQTGTYSLEYFAGTSITTGAKIALFIEENGTWAAKGSVNVPATGWSNFQPLSANQTIHINTPTVRVRLEGAGTNDWQWNLDAFELNLITPTPSTQVIPVEAENYESVGGSFADGQVERISTYSVNGITAINYVNRDDYAQYEINAMQPGEFSLSYRIGTSIQSGSAIEFQVLDNNVWLTQGQTNVNALGWNNFQTLNAAHTVSLPAGTSQVRVRGAGTNDWQWNLDSFELISAPLAQDNDNDGIPNPDDLCPTTGANQDVDANGCSAAQRDSDNDAVNDAIDECPNTPTNEAVNAAGCSSSQLDRDDDGDGVFNAQDTCPHSPSGKSVDHQGCSSDQLAGACFADNPNGIREPGAQLVEIAPSSSYAWTEGPAADAQGNLYFTDIPNNRIHKYSIDGILSTFMSNTQRANGLYFDKQGDLLMAQVTPGRIAKVTPSTVTAQDPDGNLQSVVAQYNGARFNQTNDLWLAPNGDMYFTDPCYDNCGLPQGSQQVYLLRAGTSTAVRLTNDLVNPNGIIGTPDGKVLYVSEAVGNLTVSRYTIGDNGLITDKQVFANIGGDGMTIDCENNVYITARDSSGAHYVSVRNPAGTEIERIDVPETTSNVTFAGANRDTLYITAFTSVYSLKTRVRGLPNQ